MSRPAFVVVVLGTRTEVGKTWVGAGLARWLRHNDRTVAARKPVESFEPGQGPTDAEVLAGATGEDPTAVCSISYPLPMAPPMAAEALGMTAPSIAQLGSQVSWPKGLDVGLVETAGGVGSPQALDGDAVDLLAAVDPDAALLVADAGLGTIGDVRLAAAAVRGRTGVPLAVVANRWDPGNDLHRRNLQWLRDREAQEVVAGNDFGAVWEALSSVSFKAT